MMVYTNLKRFISLEVCSALFVSCFQSTAEKRLNLSPPSCKYTELLKMMAVLTAMCILNEWGGNGMSLGSAGAWRRNTSSNAASSGINPPSVWNGAAGDSLFLCVCVLPWSRLDVFPPQAYSDCSRSFWGFGKLLSAGRRIMMVGGREQWRYLSTV